MELNLPNYFIADLPADASVTPQMLSEACLTLKRNRASYLAGRSTQQLVELLTKPGGMRQVIVAGEILRRPEERWSRGV